MDYRRLLPATPIAQIARWMRLHEEVMGVADDLWNARRFGATLLVHLAATMEEHVSGVPVAGLKSRPGDFLVYYAGHDINVYFLRRLLRINCKYGVIVLEPNWLKEVRVLTQHLWFLMRWKPGNLVELMW